MVSRRPAPSGRTRDDWTLRRSRWLIDWRRQGIRVSRWFSSTSRRHLVEVLGLRPSEIGFRWELPWIPSFLWRNILGRWKPDWRVAVRYLQTRDWRFRKNYKHLEDLETCISVVLWESLCLFKPWNAHPLYLIFQHFELESLTLLLAAVRGDRGAISWRCHK